MQLTASSFAQFFIQDEYHHVALEQHSLIFASTTDELVIPFTAWDGHITVERGIIWGKLYFHSHEEDGQQLHWLVQGLPWRDCQNFAYHAIEQYQTWYQSKSAAVRSQLPQWTTELQQLVHQTGYLPQGAISQWQDQITDELDRLDIRLMDVVHQLPAKANQLSQWLIKPDVCLEQRNQVWLEKELAQWHDYFAQCESSPLNPSQQQAILLNCNHNLILAGAGSGKTSVLCARVGYLLQSGQAQGSDILLLAFGKSAAAEMKRRLQVKFGARAKGVMVKTFHQLGLEIIRDVEEKQASNKRKKISLP
ncbi:MAG: UvrD-helicase domain-containing protein, partial [Vibrio sp.]